MSIALPKKSLLFMFLILATLGFTSLVNAKINFDSAMAIWLFDEGKGNKVKDFTGKGNDGDLNNGVEWVNGKFGMALKFDGQTGTVEINNPVNPVDPNLTIVLWVNPGATQARAHCDIISNHGEPPRAGYCIEQNGTEINKFYFDFAAEGSWQSGWQIAGAPLTQLKADTWQHFAIVREANTVTHYLNGKESGSKNNTSKAIIEPSPKNLRLSNFGWRTIDRQFNGIIDELAIFNEALTADDIRNIMNNGLAGAMAVSSYQKMITCWCIIKSCF